MARVVIVARVPIAASSLARCLGCRDGVRGLVAHAMRGVDRVGGDKVLGVQARVARMSSGKATECGDAGGEQGEQKTVHAAPGAHGTVIKLFLRLRSSQSEGK